MIYEILPTKFNQSKGKFLALIDLINVTKKFGEHTILDDVNFSISSGERIALIGKNGEGKSTLMKIILGEYLADDGRVIRQNGVSTQMLAQNPKFDDSLSVQEALNSELKEIFDALSEYENILKLSSQDPQNSELLEKQNELIKFIDSKDGWQIDNKISRVLAYFDLEEFKDRPVCTLSGGEIRRVGLGALILKKPDILLLDEPTNHLDVYMVKFLEDMLLAGKQTIVFISHDRYFIDKLATKTVEIQGAKLGFFDGGYAFYLEKKQQILASLAKTHETLLKQLKSEEEWLNRGVKARLKRNEGRKQRVFAMREEAKKNPGVIRRVRLELERAANSFAQGGFNQNRQKMLFDIRNLSKSVESKPLFKDFSARVLQRERIGIVGRNGSGKSTLLKILLGEIAADSGEIKCGEVAIGYFDQARTNLDENKTLIETFCPNGGDHIWVRGHFMHVYGYMKNFLFPKEFLDKKIGVLSGGERNRVALALLFAKEYDCLILDEPTNDLDIATINILEEYLLSFEGAIMLVSHDRYFVDKIATKLWIYDDQKIQISHLNYSEFLEFEDEKNEIDAFELENSAQTPAVLKEKTSTKLSYKQNQILANHPLLIENLEEKIDKLTASLSDPLIYNKIGLEKLSLELEEAKESLERLTDEYLLVLELI